MDDDRIVRPQDEPRFGIRTYSTVSRGTTPIEQLWDFHRGTSVTVSFLNECSGEPFVLPDNIFEWRSSLDYRDSGWCCEAMIYRLLGLDIGHRTAHPRDHYDFEKCMRLFRVAPELRDNLAKMAEVSPEWSALVSHWEEFEAAFEKPGAHPPLTTLMRECLSEVKLEQQEASSASTGQ